MGKISGKWQTDILSYLKSINGQQWNYGWTKEGEELLGWESMSSIVWCVVNAERLANVEPPRDPTNAETKAIYRSINALAQNGHLEKTRGRTLSTLAKKMTTQNFIRLVNG